MARPYDTWRPYDDPQYNYGGKYIGPVGGDLSDFSVLYALAPAGFAVTCRVTFSFDSGRRYDYNQIAYDQTSYSFPGLIDTADASFFGYVEGTTHTLRYLAGPPIKRGDQITAESLTYTVCDTPRRLNRDEMQASMTLNQS